MKIKCRPEDFRVEEIAEVKCDGGPFALYRLHKTSLGTPEAIEAICRAWRIERDAVGFGGLKDRHAVTRQFLSIRGGSRRNLRQTHFELEYLGQMERAFDSKDLLANRFEIVLRELEPISAEKLVAVLPDVVRDGIPNYFDDQRFGSVGDSGDFIARAWCLGDYERALWLALAEWNTHDRPGVRGEKTFLIDHWGDWPTCRREAVRPVTQRAIERLRRNPRDFRGAFICLPQHERRMYLSAFQSFLWNRVLAEMLRALFEPQALFDVELARTRFPFYRVTPAQAVREALEQPLPLPSARGRAELGSLAGLYERIAAEFGLECRTLRVKYPRDSFFSRGARPAIFRPKSLDWEPGEDDRAKGQRKLTLRFDLPPGCYATILLKRVAESL